MSDEYENKTGYQAQSSETITSGGSGGSGTTSDADYVNKGAHFGPHNIYENRPDGLVSSDTIFATYQNAGVRVFDISNEYRVEEIAAFVPPDPRTLADKRPNRQKVIQSCDVWVSKEGLVYSNDFNGGLYILEYVT